MFRNYFLIAVRNIVKRSLYSFINAFGLSIGIAFCVLIWLFIQDEHSFDRFHENGDRLYRVHASSFSEEALKRGEKEPYEKSAWLPAKLGDVMLDELAEVEYMTRFNSGGQGVMRYKDKFFSERYAMVDSGFFHMFSFPLTKGSAKKIFSTKSEIVITKEIAEKYFGTEDPIGKEITLDLGGIKNFTVAAIIQTPPANTAFDFNILVPIEASPWFARSRDQWGNYSFPIFVQVRPNTDQIAFKTHLDKLADKYLGDRFKKWRERESIPAQFKVSEFHAMPIADIHLASDISFDRVSDPKYSMILGGIALLILIIACINYISLALTTSVSRRVEVGIRKVVGAQKNQLIYQFSIESVILGLISMVIGIGMVFLFLTPFNEFTGKSISIGLQSFLPLVGFSFAITLVVGLIAGSYPSIFISRFMPAQVLKGGFTSKVQAGFTRPLVVLQFALSAFLIISAVIMYRQMNYITAKDLGYNKEQVLVVATQSGWTADADKVVERFRNQAIGNPAIESVAGTSISFNMGYSRYGYKIKGENKSAYIYMVDPGYLSLLGVPMVSGRNFDPHIASDSAGIIVNEALVKDMGWKDPLNEHLNYQEDTVGIGAPVIGVVKDYHFMSLEKTIEPMFMTISQKQGHMTTLLVKTTKGDVPARLASVKKLWTELNPDKPFEYTFLDEDVAKQYQRYTRWMNIMGLSTGFAILIACLGLFGLAGINAVNRTKEVGIRKVMGANLFSIFVLLNRQYTWLAIIAFALATPASWYVMTHWFLSSFQFRITVGWEIFAVSMLAGLALALLTVSYHAIRVSLTNPAETLKYE